MVKNDTLKSLSAKVRSDIILMSYTAQSAHMGGALSCVEILVALYFSIMNVDPANPESDNRDRLIFSKAHDAKALYAVLCQRGYFPEKVLSGYEQNNGKLPGHSTRNCVPGVEVSAGALGHGLSMAVGMAYAAKLKSEKHRVFAVLSDGECDEGSVWEAAMFAGHHALSQLIVIIDYNKLQGYGYTKDVLDLTPFREKWRSFGFSSQEIDGHNFSEIQKAVTRADQSKKPTCIIANTVKGQGGPVQHINQISSQYIPASKKDL